MKKACPIDGCPPRQKRQTKAELMALLEEATTVMGQAQRLIAALVSVAEGGDYDHGDLNLSSPALRRAIAAKMGDTAAREVLQKEVTKLKADEKGYFELMRLSAKRLNAMGASIRRRDAAIGLLSVATKHADSPIPLTVDIAIAGALASRIE
jgi:hypothetical protein